MLSLLETQILEGNKGWSQSLAGENLLVERKMYTEQLSDLEVHLEEWVTNNLEDFYKCVGQGPLVPREGPFNLIKLIKSTN